MRNVTPERLEPRVLCAGDVAVRFARGGLSLRGDAGANAILIERDGAGPGVRVTGQDGTTLNGQAGPLTFGAVTRDLKAKLGGGDDRFTISGVNVGRNLSLDTGEGKDAVALDGGRVGRCLSVKGKSGAKSVDVRFADVGGRTKVSTGNEADAVNLGGSTFAKRVSLSTGKGDDAITLASEFAKGRSVKDGPGNDSLVEGVYRGFDFRDGDQGWAADFADYQDGYVLVDGQGRPLAKFPEANELQSGLRPLPPELNDPGTGFLLSGINGSDDLFMFLKRALGPDDGVQPGQTYRVEFDITFASNAPTGCLGLGGPPGEAVFLLAGARTTEPTTFVGTSDERPYVMVVPEGEGRRTEIVSNIANGNPCAQGDEDLKYVSLTRRHTFSEMVTADASGRLWVLVGTDSGNEDRTTVYYQQVRVTLTPAAESRPSADHR